MMKDATEMRERDGNGVHSDRSFTPPFPISTVPANGMADSHGDDTHHDENSTIPANPLEETGKAEPNMSLHDAPHVDGRRSGITSCGLRGPGEPRAEVHTLPDGGVTGQSVIAPAPDISSNPFKTGLELIGLTEGTIPYYNEIHNAITVIVSDLDNVKLNPGQLRTIKNRIKKEVMKYLEE